LLREAHEAHRDPPLHDAVLSHALLQGWAGFLRAGKGPTRSLHPAVSRTLQMCRENPDGPSLDRLAEACGISPTYLSRLFKQQLGVGLSEYRNRCRLERFFTLREAQPHQSLLAIALQAGFGSYAQFHRVCRSQTGQSPHRLESP
jgi:AraC-like DNA-binding protein